MRRRPLPPARPWAEALAKPPLPVPGAPARAGRPGPLGRESLGEPSTARPRARRYFNPVSGWFRRLERAVNQFLSGRIFSRISWIDRPYAVQLDRMLTISEAEIPLSRLPEAFDGTTVMLITDVHTGPFLTVRGLRRTFGRLAALSPDLILLGGDLTTSAVADLRTSLAAYAGLSAPLGVHAVLGNHEHYTGEPSRVRELLSEAGVGVLHNRAVALERGGERLILAGIDDLNAGKPDLDAALADARRLAVGDGGPAGETSPAPILLLSHNPDVFFEASRRGVSLVLSGHTHGGQIRIPGLPVLVRMSRYRLDHGRYVANGAELVVSRGLGASGLPLRIACSPEAVLLTLRRTT